MNCKVDSLKTMQRCAVVCTYNCNIYIAALHLTASSIFRGEQSHGVSRTAVGKRISRDRFDRNFFGERRFMAKSIVKQVPI